jgi:hypothetical protein
MDATNPDGTVNERPKALQDVIVPRTGELTATRGARRSNVT